MLTKTTRSAIRMLPLLGLREGMEPIPPRRLAERLGESPTYLAKVARDLVKAGILRSHRGVSGGVVLERDPREITLLAIAEACQGTAPRGACEEWSAPTGACIIDRACAESHQEIARVLSQWTLAEFVERPRPVSMSAEALPCWAAPELRGAQLPVVGNAACTQDARVAATRRVIL